MLRGINRQTIFEYDEDKSKFIATLAIYKEVRGLNCMVYRLMGNHVYLLVKEVKESISIALIIVATVAAGAGIRGMTMGGLLIYAITWIGAFSIALAAIIARHLLQIDITFAHSSKNSSPFSQKLPYHRRSFISLQSWWEAYSFILAVI